MDILSVVTELTNDVARAGITLLVKGFLGEQIEDLANVSKRKLKNLGSAVEKISEKWKAKGIKIEENVQEIEPEILQPILEGVYIGHKDEIIREKWINLLESAILGNSIHPIYTETLKLIDVIDANILEIFTSDFRTRGNRLTNTAIKELLQQKKLDVTEDMITDSLFNLVTRELCDVRTLQGKPTHNDMNSENMYLSKFGKKFMNLVNGVIS